MPRFDITPGTLIFGQCDGIGAWVVRLAVAAACLGSLMV
jgi:hypothetical protein